MVEPLKKEDIEITWADEEPCIQVSRIKEIVEGLYSDKQLPTHLSLEHRILVKNLIKYWFAPLFDAQSPEKLETSVSEDKDEPSQVVVSESPSERVSKNPVGVSSLCQKCGHEKRDHYTKKDFKSVIKKYGHCWLCSVLYNNKCFGFVEKTK